MVKVQECPKCIKASNKWSTTLLDTIYQRLKKEKQNEKYLITTIITT